MLIPLQIFLVSYGPPTISVKILIYKLISALRPNDFCNYMLNPERQGICGTKLGEIGSHLNVLNHFLILILIPANQIMISSNDAILNSHKS